MTGQDLLDLAASDVATSTDHPQRLEGGSADVGVSEAVNSEVLQVRRSALWAAYGDALGWISELTDAAGLKRRTVGEPLRRPIQWKRRIGGRTGITASLPVGCYSDDSQLRLATGRAIHTDGFDVEAFAKVELPVWLSYALGGGKSTAAAATNLVKPKAVWYANTFKGWTRSGGNGAAMRVQPHVWAARTRDIPESFLPDVVRNAVCTHSHPTGLIGAVLHALALAHVMAKGTCMSPRDFLDAVEVAANLPDMIRNDTEVGNYWLGAFEREAESFAAAWARAVAESKEAIRLASGTGTTGETGYGLVVERLGLRDPARRGSGMLTAVAAVALIWCESQPEEALRIAANALATDTDTIATMAGAILGAAAERDPPVEVLDAELFRSEADRLAAIARGKRPMGHQYPDLLHWSAPRTRADTLAQARDGGLFVRGLGCAEATSEPIPSPKGDFQWQWLKLRSGQSLLMKRRRNLVAWGDADALPRDRLPSRSPPLSSGAEAGSIPEGKKDDLATRASRPAKAPFELQKALDYLDKNKDNDERIGKLIRRVVNKGSPGEIGGFVAALIDTLRQSEVSPVRPIGSQDPSRR